MNPFVRPAAYAAKLNAFLVVCSVLSAPVIVKTKLLAV